jgi:hypothetical protein
MRLADLSGCNAIMNTDSPNEWIEGKPYPAFLECDIPIQHDLNTLLHVGAFLVSYLS